MNSSNHQKQTKEKQKPQLFRNPLERKFDHVISPFEDFIHDAATGSILLFFCAVIAFAIAHSPWSNAYQSLLQLPFGVLLGGWQFEKELHHWVNDGLMVLFFFVIGLVIKRELLAGELNNLRISIPIIAASVGGMIMPALIYTAFNLGTPAVDGWGIAVATDTAFAIGVLALLGRRVPATLATFLTALAIIDDIGAVLVIAFFYTGNISLPHLAMTAALLAALLLLNILGVRRPSLYLLGGTLVWLAMLESGIHASVAGILVALTVPARPRHGPLWFTRKTRRLINEFEKMERRKQTQHGNKGILSADDQASIVDAVQDTAHEVATPLQLWEKALETPVALLVLPIFALANAGVAIEFSSLSSSLVDTTTLGIVFGLVVGKVLGITGLCWLAVKTNLGDLPRTMNFKHVIGLGFLGGMGFTMSIFIANLSFGNSPEQLNIAKFAILLGTFIAGLCGYLWLRFTSSAYYEKTAYGHATTNTSKH